MISESDWTTIVIRLGLSVLLGGIIGIERELHGKSAGLRTHMLVALGSTLFTIVSYVMPLHFKGEGVADPTRIAAQIITGVGFLGAGTIIQGRGSVHGLTTAASIWLVSAIGMAVGSGFYRGALLATLLGHVVLVLLNYAENAVIRRKASRRVVRASLAGDFDSRWFQELIGGMQLESYRWHAHKTASGARILLDSRFRRDELERFVEALRKKCEIKILHVERR
jgi:putative Mg2+ transporter-C (MgtC) family protein